MPAGGTRHGPWADLEERIAEALAARCEPGSVERKRMFGHRAFMVAGKMAITAGADGLLVRVDPARSAELLARPGARQAVMGEKDMGPSWLTVAADAVASDGALADWVEVALDYNRVLTDG